MIARGDTVVLHYELRLKRNEVIESTFADEPRRIVFGSGEFPASLEREIADLAPGQERRFTLAGRDRAFGVHDPANVRTLPREDFDGLDWRVGSLVEFELPSGEFARGRIEGESQDGVEVDFNNPLIGRDVECRVRVLGVSAGAAA